MVGLQFEFEKARRIYNISCVTTEIQTIEGVQKESHRWKIEIKIKRKRVRAPNPKHRIVK